MSTRLERLAAKLEAMPEPGDIVEAAALTGAQAQGMMLAYIPTLDDAESKLELLDGQAETLDSLVSLLDEKHDAIVILRQMLAIVRADAEGRPEPTDKELARIAGKGGGCLSFVALLALAVAVGLAWAAA